MIRFATLGDVFQIFKKIIKPRSVVEGTVFCHRSDFSFNALRVRADSLLGVVAVIVGSSCSCSERKLKCWWLMSKWLNCKLLVVIVSVVEILVVELVIVVAAKGNSNVGEE